MVDQLLLTLNPGSSTLKLGLFRLRANGPQAVVAHLGSRVSLCGLEVGCSRDTGMAFSTLDGIPMGTRRGALDPGVLLHLLRRRGLSVDDLEDLRYRRSGLLGVSGLSAAVRELLASETPAAREALALFALRTAREVAGLTTTLGALDALVFTAGIGEHQPAVRDAVCRRLARLGVHADSAANAANCTRFDNADSRVALLAIPTDEEQVLAEEACRVLPPTFLPRS